jgi:hypothetical protein
MLQTRYKVLPMYLSLRIICLDVAAVRCTKS